jgi:site-specific DNA-methyltransferase (adenine-specific)
MLEINKIHQGDCMELMQHIPDKSVDMILCDLPYGTTDCEWDKVLPLDALWKQYKRIIKDNGVIVLYGNNIFSIKLASTNISMFKYKYVWIKNNSTLFVHAKNRPLVKHEDILIFSNAPMGHISLLNDKRMPYNPQGITKVTKRRKRHHSNFKNTYGKRPSHKLEIEVEAENYPTDVLTDYPELLGNKTHPNEKPESLNRFLIQTYTQEGELVLDNCAGTGSTLVACKQTNRKFIGIELSQEYVDIANKRLNQETLFKFESNQEVLNAQTKG